MNNSGTSSSSVAVNIPQHHHSSYHNANTNAFNDDGGRNHPLQAMPGKPPSDPNPTTTPLNVFNQSLEILGITPLLGLGKNGIILFLNRAVRMCAFGAVSVVLALYLRALGLSDAQMGLFLTLTFVGDAGMSLIFTTHADRWGRRRMLTIGSLLMVFAGIVLAGFPEGLVAGVGASHWFVLIAMIGIIGIISPSGKEVGPFLPLEQSILSDHVHFASRTSVFALYNYVGFTSTALGALVGGWTFTILTTHYNYDKIDGYRAVVLMYGAISMTLVVACSLLSRDVEQRQSSKGHNSRDDERTRLLESRNGDQSETGSFTSDDGVDEKPNVRSMWSTLAGFDLTPESRMTVLKLCFVIVLDVFASSLVTGTILAYWLKRRYNANEGLIGSIFFICQMISGHFALLAGWLARRIGLINTMVFTHLPANIMLLCLPLMPNIESAMALLFLRYTIAELNAAPRQAFILSVVRPEERTAVMGTITFVKSIASSLGPVTTGLFAQVGWFDGAFFLGGALKVLYDLLLLVYFSSVKFREMQDGVQGDGNKVHDEEAVLFEEGDDEGDVVVDIGEDDRHNDSASGSGMRR
ncbi:hypothetical protein HDU76_002722 [Blyttiomyces sp. JEL0837]|nr:hypothetical protein HDU76_002722 [Blyttiomyces sp. JEL0837]